MRREEECDHNCGDIKKTCIGYYEKKGLIVYIKGGTMVEQELRKRNSSMRTRKKKRERTKVS